ncbi:MAG TPA: tetratricopeptide repeat protein [Bacteroidetes bacterium]|nr:tetratricopeptide repeat protein [Bacteroidota bacterium]
MNYKISILFLFAALLFACTPKTPEAVTETKPAPPSLPEIKDNPCATFEDAPDPDQALENFVLYRDFLKTKEWDLAYGYWQKVYKDAPAADGKRANVFTDGVRFYEHFMEEDKSKKQEYLNKILSIYEKMAECYPEGGYAQGLKAFDYFFKYPDLLTKEQQFELFKKSVDLDKGKPRFFVLNPMTSLLVDLTLEGKIPIEEAKKYQKIIMDAIKKGLAECQGDECDNWKIINEYAPARLEALESIRGFYDCAYYLEKYYPVFQANPTDCETINSVYSSLRFGGCDKASAELQALNTAYETNCKKEKDPTCNDMLREGQYREAIKCLEKAIGSMSDKKDKATYNLFIAKIYYAHLKSYSNARKYARKAISLRPNWGEPYILIGTLYASSGPLCGPGRGWDSQRVVWPAIDKWQKAKSVDPSVAREANRLINQYSQYMPELGEIFQRGLKVGQPYFVPCWIQETTTIRAKK